MNEEDEIRFEGTYYDCVPDGQYLAKCFDYVPPKPFKGTRKLLLWFELLDPQPWTGKKLFMPFNIPYKGPSPGSKYFKAWSIAHGGLPTRNAVMSPMVFKGKTFLVKTRTTRPRHGDEEMPWEHQYSVIDYIKMPRNSQSPSDLTDREEDSIT